MVVQLDAELLKLRKKYQGAHEDTQKARQRELVLLGELRLKCGEQEHKFIAEVPYVVEVTNDFRVCEICGYSEEDKGTGYRVLLAKRVRKVSMEEGNNLTRPLGEIEY